jgi:4-azaleucine resistance transporter AzlC
MLPSRGYPSPIERKEHRVSMWPHIRRGLRATLPVALGVAPFGVAYGTVAAITMAPWQAQLMSLTVFAGTAQFIAASMLSEGAAYLAVLLTGVLINLRLLLLSAALAPHVAMAPRPLQPVLAPRPLQPVLAQLLTDESFAVSMAEFEQHGSDWRFFIGSGLAVFGVWQVATAVGMAFGATVPSGLGLDFALPASLICLLFLLVRERRAAIVALGAAAVSVALVLVVPGTWNVMVATLLAATVGAAWKR